MTELTTDQLADFLNRISGEHWDSEEMFDDEDQQKLRLAASIVRMATKPGTLTIAQQIQAARDQIRWQEERDANAALMKQLDAAYDERDRLRALKIAPFVRGGAIYDETMQRVCNERDRLREALESVKSMNDELAAALTERDRLRADLYYAQCNSAADVDDEIVMPTFDQWLKERTQ